MKRIQSIRIWGVITMLLLYCIPLQGSAGSAKGKGKEKEKAPVRISLDEGMAWQPLLDANGGMKTAKGSIYHKLGLDIEFVVIPDPVTAASSVIKGEAVGAGYTINRYALLQERFDRNNVQVRMPLLMGYSDGEEGIIANADIQSAKDLIGKRIAVVEFSETQSFVEWLLKNAELTEQEWEDTRQTMLYTKTTEEAGEALFAGQADAAAAWGPYLTQARKAADVAVLFDTSMSTSLMLSGIVFRQEFLDENQDFVVKFIEGALEEAPTYGQKASGVKPATWAQNKELLQLNGIAADIYKDMAEIWKALGKAAYPEKAQNAFTDEFILMLAEKYETQEAGEERRFTEGNRRRTLEAGEANALMRYTLDIEFEPNAVNIAAISYEELDAIIRVASILDGMFIQIEGNASTRAAGITDEQIKGFSLSRADAIAAYFIQKGIQADRIITIGNGDSKPVADDSTEEGKAQNRRTEIYIKPVVAE